MLLYWLTERAGTFHASLVASKEVAAGRLDGTVFAIGVDKNAPSSRTYLANRLAMLWSVRQKIARPFTC